MIDFSAHLAWQAMLSSRVHRSPSGFELEKIGVRRHPVLPSGSLAKSSRVLNRSRVGLVLFHRLAQQFLRLTRSKLYSSRNNTIFDNGSTTPLSVTEEAELHNEHRSVDLETGSVMEGANRCSATRTQINIIHRMRWDQGLQQRDDVMERDASWNSPYICFVTKTSAHTTTKERPFQDGVKPERTRAPGNYMQYFPFSKFPPFIHHLFIP